MFSQANVFEHPLNERIRTFLRLEHLFDKVDYFVPRPEEWATRAIIEALLDILIVARTDIKNEIVKELERYNKILIHIGEQTGVDLNALKRITEELEGALENIHRLDGQIAQPLRDSEFLKAIMQRNSIPGGSCEFDLPHYGYWLRQPHAQRQIQIDAWMQDLLPIRDGLGLLLKLIRSSCDAKPATATDGVYQEILDAQAQVQMVRVQIDSSLVLFPEISGHKHRFNIRFMEIKDAIRPVQTEQDVAFLLTCCVL